MNITYINELEELVDIIDTICADDEDEDEDDEDLIFTEEDHIVDFVETALHLMDIYIQENPTAISEPDFESVFKETIKDLFYIQFEEHINLNENIEDDIEEALEDAFNIYFSLFCQTREENNITQENNTQETNNDNFNIIQQKINYLRLLPQPTQRTDEWYKFRHNLITASNAYKAFESQSTMNQLIYEKCQPLKMAEENKTTMVNVNSTFHWGQKYEPLSVMIYEYLYNTKVEDFGCIQHSTYKFLGASPDGINIDQTSSLYGRMLEIKNVVNREITGIPKKEYWIQTQLQMEVCDLDECDFLETKFVEYPDSDTFFNDGSNDKTVKNELKGIIMYFNTVSGKPFYLYKPLNIVDYAEMNKWEEEMLDTYQGPDHNMIWITSHYWKLEKLSCVLVIRNKKWFQDNIGQIENIWNIVEKERVTGYDHRAPVKRVKKTIVNNNDLTSFNGCLINITKLH